jgi:hypothetical protein
LKTSNASGGAIPPSGNCLAGRFQFVTEYFFQLPQLRRNHVGAVGLETVALVVTLVVIFGLVELARRYDFRHNETVERAGGIQFLLVLLGQRFLLGGVVENG